jgi:hypothetical protein
MSEKVAICQERIVGMIENEQKLFNMIQLIEQTKKPFFDQFIDIYERSSNKHNCEAFIGGIKYKKIPMWGKGL